MQNAARSREILEQYNITHVVNCTADMPLYFEGELRYLRFNITKHYSQVLSAGSLECTRNVLQVNDARSALRFVQPLFEFVGDALSDGAMIF